ncbi:MAG: hypothetical protein ACTSV5_08695 [Promethearchaeota archaeon]
MTSISSANNIKTRTIEFCSNLQKKSPNCFKGKKNPEYYPQIEKILGKHYILYFDEKRNRLAKPF